MRLREADVSLAVRRYLTTKGYLVVAEFPFLGRVVDIFGLRPTDDATVTIECKESDWRKASTQARVASMMSQSAYVAMPARKVTNAALLCFQASGVGLLIVNDDSSVVNVLEPSADPIGVAELHLAAKQRFLDLVELGYRSD